MKTAPTKEIFNFIISEFNVKSLQIVDFWDSDNCAFGITNLDKTILIYISTFNREKGKYFLEIEHNNGKKDNFENINRKELEKILKPILSNYES